MSTFHETDAAWDGAGKLSRPMRRPRTARPRLQNLRGRAATWLEAALAGRRLPLALADYTEHLVAKATPPFRQALAARRRLSAGDMAGALERFQSLLAARPDHPAALLALADACALGLMDDDFGRFVDEHDARLRDRLSRIGLARIVDHLLHRGWLEQAEAWLDHRLQRTPRSPALRGAWARLVREARRRQRWDVWTPAEARLRSWTGASPAARTALGRLDAPLRWPAGPIESEPVAEGHMHLFACRHLVGKSRVFEKAVLPHSPELAALRAMRDGRLEPPRGALTFPRFLGVSRRGGYLSILWEAVDAPPLSSENFMARLPEIVGAIGRFNADNLAGAALGGLPPLVDPLDDHARDMERTLNLFEGDEAVALGRAWESALEEAPKVRARLAAAPQAFQHNDVMASNLLATEPPTLIDWGQSGIGPVGMELRSMLLTADERQYDDGWTDELLETYLRAFTGTPTPEDREGAKIALWWSYFARFATAPDEEARHIRMARRAILQGAAVAARC